MPSTKVRRARIYTPKKAKTLVRGNPWMQKGKYPAIRALARKTYRRAGGKLRRDRLYKGKLVKYAVWSKGKNPRRYDLGVGMKGGRLVRIFD